jgi:hypothetical protein
MGTTLQQKIDHDMFVVDGILMDIEDDALLDVNEWYDLLTRVKDLIENIPLMTPGQKAKFIALRNRFFMISEKLKELELGNPFENSVL